MDKGVQSGDVTLAWTCGVEFGDEECGIPTTLGDGSSCYFSMAACTVVVFL